MSTIAIVLHTHKPHSLSSGTPSFPLSCRDRKGLSVILVACFASLSRISRSMVIALLTSWPVGLQSQWIARWIQHLLLGLLFTRQLHQSVKVCTLGSECSGWLCTREYSIVLALMFPSKHLLCNGYQTTIVTDWAMVAGTSRFWPAGWVFHGLLYGDSIVMNLSLNKGCVGPLLVGGRGRSSRAAMHTSN